MCLYKHEKQLYHPDEVKRFKSQSAALLQEQLGSGDDAREAAMLYMSQRFPVKASKIKEHILDSAAEGVKMYFTMSGPGSDSFTGKAKNSLALIG